MEQLEYHVIGVMSGTSLDGIDLIYATFNLERQWTYHILKSETVPYDDFWTQSLSSLVTYSKEELSAIDKDYTMYIVSTIKNFIQRNEIQKLDAVCSHGHTALHQPDKGITYQIGNRQELAKLIGHKVVCDFRVQDVKLGGQGAPLVPIGDKLLFPQYDFCLNLGGFANVSMDINNARIAYDICPVNIVLNHYVRNLGFNFDEGGNIARSGRVNSVLLEALNDLKFYSAGPPKSLGLEWVSACVLPIIDSCDLPIKDILSTLVDHIAFQISKEINKQPSTKVLVTGGGAYNSFLIENLQKYTNNKIVIPDKNTIEFKEALIFGFLGVLRLRGEVNCLSSVTGASKDHSSGVVFTP